MEVRLRRRWLLEGPRGPCWRWTSAKGCWRAPSKRLPGHGAASTAHGATCAFWPSDSAHALQDAKCWPHLLLEQLAQPRTVAAPPANFPKKLFLECQHWVLLLHPGFCCPPGPAGSPAPQL